jgi:hypothetical protein
MVGNIINTIIALATLGIGGEGAGETPATPVAELPPIDVLPAEEPVGRLAPEPPPVARPQAPLTGKLWPNRSSGSLHEELALAHRLGVEPVKVTSPESLAGFEGQTLNYVVSEEGELLTTPRSVRVGEQVHRIHHTVPVKGRPVLAAGEVTPTGNVARINRISGHYGPGPETLDIAAEAFRRAGFKVECSRH